MLRYKKNINVPTPLTTSPTSSYTDLNIERVTPRRPLPLQVIDS